MNGEKKTCPGCKGTGWKGGVHLLVICDAGCAGSGSYQIVEAPAVYEDRITEYGLTQRLSRSVRIF